MYFLRSILLVFLIIISCFFIYQYISDRKDINISKKTIITAFLILLQGLLMIFSDNIVFYIFIDFPCIIAYLLKFRKEAIILSMINILYFNIILSTPWYYHIIYLIYLTTDCLLVNNRKEVVNYFSIIKSFINSFIYFINFDNSIVNLTSIILLCIYFYLLLVFIYNTIRNYEINKNEDSLLFKIAHEVKNPIAVCKGYLDMLDYENKEKTRKYIPIVKSEMNRALTIMDDFLNLKRLSVQKDIMDFNLLVEDVEKTMQTVLSNQNIELELINNDDEIYLDGDYERLKQVLINLIKNSQEANAKNIKMQVKSQKNNIELKIIDDGDGINEKDLKKIGQLFYTTKSKGTGIGVSMSKEIVKLHQGTIKYNSSVGKGTTVILELPCCLSF